MFSDKLKRAAGAACMFSFLSLGLFADPPGFDKSIEADYDDMTLKKALEELQDDSGLSMVLSPNLAFKTRVNIVVDKAPARKILGWLCEQAEMDYFLDDDVIIVGTRREIREKRANKFRKRLVSKRYYIRDLLGELRDFRGPEISLGGGEEAGGGISIEESSSETDEPMSGEDLVEVIVASISPETWDDDNGSQISLRNGGINVRTTPEIHAKIKEMLEEHRKSKSRMVEVTVRVHEVSGDQLIDLMDQTDGQALNAKGEELIKKHKMLHYGRNVGHSSQRFTITSLKQMAYVRDLTAVVNVQTGILDPDIGYLQAGLSVDVRATASQDGKTVLLENRSTYTRILESKVELYKDDSSFKGADGSRTESKAERRIELPQMETGAARSTLRAPVDKWMPFVMSERDGKYTVMCMRCRVIDR